MGVRNASAFDLMSKFTRDLRPICDGLVNVSKLRGGAGRVSRFPAISRAVRHRPVPASPNLPEPPQAGEPIRNRTKESIPAPGWAILRCTAVG